MKLIVMARVATFSAMGLVGEQPIRALSFNGGDPSGRAWKSRWSGWGSGVALARGLTWINAPRGGYYKKPGAVELPAYFALAGATCF